MHAPPTPDQNLARAIEKLTSTHIIQHRIRMLGGGRRVHEEHRPALIVLLRSGALPSAESNASTANTRSVVDGDSIQKLRELDRTINTLWSTLLPGIIKAGMLRYKRLPEETLAAWHDMFTIYRRAGMATATELGWAERVCTGWVSVIEAKFDPPTMKENIDPCPECGARRVRIGAGVDEREMFAITYQLRVDSIIATCRACGSEWHGETELRELGRAQRQRAYG